MKATLEFTLPDEKEEFELATKAVHFSIALSEIANEVLRPHRKHGYSDPELSKLCESDEVLEAIGLLEKKFYEILNENGVNI